MGRCSLVSEMLFLYKILLSSLLWFVQLWRHPGDGMSVRIVAQNGTNCRDMAVRPPQKDLLQQKASLSPSLAGTSCKQGAPCLVEVLGSHRCCRGDGLYLNLIGKCEELWATLAFSTQWPGDPVFQGVLWVLVCVLLQQMFLEHLLPARLLHALVKVVNEPQPLPCLGPSPPLKTVV